MRIERSYLLLLAIFSYGLIRGLDATALVLSSSSRPATVPGDTLEAMRLLGLARRTMASKPDSALIYSQQVLALARRARLPRQEAQALEHIGWVHFVRGDYPVALRIYQQALTVAQAVRFAKECAVLHADIGSVLQEQGAFPEALENDLSALHYYGLMRDSTHLAYSILNVASVEYNEHHYAQAIAYYQQAFRLLQKNKDEDDLNTSYQGLAMVYADLGEFKRAETYFRLGLKTFQRKKDTTNVAIALNNLGDIYSKQKRYSQARGYFERALQLASATKDESMIAVTCDGLAQVLFELASYPQALAYAQRSLALAERIKAQPVAKDACIVMANVLAAQRQFEPALAFYKQGKGLEDSIYGSKHTAQIDALRNQYQQYRREQEESVHRYRILQLERDQRISRLTLVLVLGISLGFLVLGWLFWRQYHATRQRDQARQLAQQASERVDQLLNEAKLHEAEYELELKNKKLTSLTLSVMQKGEFLHEVKERLDVIARTANDEVRKQLARLRQNIEQNGPANKEWEQFRLMFEEVHQNFFSELQRQYPDVTPNELRLAALLRLNFSSKAMAGLLGISEESIKKARYRLRQKLQLNTTDNLVEFMMRLDGSGNGDTVSATAENTKYTDNN